MLILETWPVATKQEDLGRKQIRRPGKSRVENIPYKARQEYRKILSSEKGVCATDLGKSCDSYYTSGLLSK